MLYPTPSTGPRFGPIFLVRSERVLGQIDPECRQPGCHAITFRQYCHIQPYAQDGPTILANLQRLCGPHNRARTGDDRR